MGTLAMMIAVAALTVVAFTLIHIGYDQWLQRRYAQQRHEWRQAEAERRKIEAQREYRERS